MSLPEGYLPRRGDVIVLHAVVKFDVDSPGEERVSISIRDHDTNWIDLSKIVGLHARHWEVGENVRVTQNGQPGEVIGVDGEHVWIKPPGGGVPYTCEANELQPAEPPPPPVPELEPPAPPSPAESKDEEEII